MVGVELTIGDNCLYMWGRTKEKGTHELMRRIRKTEIAREGNHG